MADIFFKCRACGKHLLIEEAGIGMTLDCVHCSQSVVVPAPAGEVECAHCRQRLKVGEGMGGEQTNCPSCRQPLTVPGEPGSTRQKIRLKRELPPPPPPKDPGFAPAPARGRGRTKVRRLSGPPVWRWVVIAGLAWAAFAGYQFVRRELARAEATNQTAELVGGVIEEDITLAAAALKLAPLLRTAPPFLGSYCRGIAAGKDEVNRDRRANTLAGIIEVLPSSAELSPLLEIPRKLTWLYERAVALMGARAPVDWLLAQSCRPAAEERRFAAAALRFSFPFGVLDEGGVARLAAAMAVTEKQRLYEELWDAAHRSWVEQLTGRYSLRIDATWQKDERQEVTVSYQSVQPCLHVSCEEREWSIRFFDASGRGAIQSFPELIVPATVPKSHLLGRTDLIGSESVQLRLHCSNGVWLVACEVPLPPYKPGYSEETGAIITRYNDGVVEDRYRQTRWVPAIPGFAKMEGILSKTLADPRDSPPVTAE